MDQIEKLERARQAIRVAREACGEAGLSPRVADGRNFYIELFPALEGVIDRAFAEANPIAIGDRVLVRGDGDGYDTLVSVEGVNITLRHVSGAEDVYDFIHGRTRERGAWIDARDLRRIQRDFPFEPGNP